MDGDATCSVAGTRPVRMDRRPPEHEDREGCTGSPRTGSRQILVQERRALYCNPRHASLRHRHRISGTDPQRAPVPAIMTITCSLQALLKGQDCICSYFIPLLALLVLCSPRTIFVHLHHPPSASLVTLPTPFLAGHRSPAPQLHQPSPASSSSFPYLPTYILRHRNTVTSCAAVLCCAFFLVGSVIQVRSYCVTHFLCHSPCPAGATAWGCCLTARK